MDKETLYYIEGHLYGHKFTGGVVIIDAVVTRAADILRCLIGKDERHFLNFCKQKRFYCERVSTE